MRYSEFNNDWSDMELQYLEGEIFIYCDGVMIGKVSKEYRYMMSTHYEGFELLPLPVAVKLFADMAMLSETPLAEREEEKRYWLRFIHPNILGAREPFYLHLHHSESAKDYYDMGTVKVPFGNKLQTIFTESEIAEMDITGFQKVEVVG